MTQHIPVNFPAYSLSNVPDPKSYRDQGIVIVAADGTRVVNYSDGTVWAGIGVGVGAGVTDGDKGDIVVSGTGAAWAVKDATAAVKGKVQLAGALGGTAAAPTVFGLADTAAFTASQALKTTDIMAGLSFASAADVADGDTVKTALGKFQAKWNGFAASVRSVTLTGFSTATSTAVTAADGILAAMGKLQAQITAGVGANATGARGLADMLMGYAYQVPTGASSTSVSGIGMSSLGQLDSSTLGVSGYTSNPYGSIRKILMTAAASAANRVAGARSIQTVYFGATGRSNGRFPAVLLGSIEDTSHALGTFFLGLTGTATPDFTATQPSAMTGSLIGFALDESDANLQFIRNDATGSATKVDLGSNFVRDRLQMWSVIIDKNLTGSEMYFQVMNLNTEAVSSVFTVTTDLPVSGPLSVVLARSSLSSVFQPIVAWGGWGTGKIAGGGVSGGGGGGSFGTITGVPADNVALMAYLDPDPVAAETVGRALTSADNRKRIYVNAAVTADFTLAAGVGATGLKSVDVFREGGVGQVSVTVDGSSTLDGITGGQIVLPLTYQGAFLEWRGGNAWVSIK